MSLFAISDLHLANNNKEKAMDVFSGWEDYTNRLKKNWIKIVRPGDTVVIAGDLSWAMKLEDSLADFIFLDSLPGNKILIKGNHDFWWSSKSKILNFLQQNNFHNIDIIYNSAIETQGACVCGTRGWLYNPQDDQEKKIVLREAGRLNTSILEAKKFSDEPIVFLHYPPVYGGTECKEILDVLVKHGIKKCYYGHIHGNLNMKNTIQGNYNGINFYLISADFLCFTPKLILK